MSSDTAPWEMYDALFYKLDAAEEEVMGVVKTEVGSIKTDVDSIKTEVGAVKRELSFVGRRVSRLTLNFLRFVRR